MGIRQSGWGCQNKKTTVWWSFYFESADPTGCARVPTLVRMHHMKTQFSWATPTGTHGEYADEQLANLQKRIWLIEFLRLGLIIGCQGAMLALPNLIFRPFGRIFYYPHMRAFFLFSQRSYKWNLLMYPHFQESAQPECTSGKKRLVPRYEKYVWVTVGDDKVRPEHEALDGEVRTWYDTPHPGEEYGCRCHAESVD